MRTVTATDAKTNLGELLGTLSNGPVEITRNGRTVAILRAPESPDRPAVTDQARVEQLMRGYAAGTISRRDLQEQTGLAFGEVLAALGRLALPLPLTDTGPRYSLPQRRLIARILGSAK